MVIVIIDSEQLLKGGCFGETVIELITHLHTLRLAPDFVSLQGHIKSRSKGRNVEELRLAARRLLPGLQSQQSAARCHNFQHSAAKKLHAALMVFSGFSKTLTIVEKA